MGYTGIESVVQGNSAKCIEACFKVHFPNAETVADLTYGKGRFWNWNHNLDIVGLDVEPSGGASILSDYRNVPLKDKSVDVAVFDPPFIFSPGLRGIVGAKRFFLGPKDAEQRFYSGADRQDLRILAPRNADDLHKQTVDVVREMIRIAKCGMILKGQDLITSQHPNWWTYRVMKDIWAFYGPMPEDMLIQVSPAARLADPRWKHQYHFRRRHAIYLVYKFS